VLAHDPAVKVHLYGKEVRPGRKLGHVNLAGSGGADALLARARHAADFIAGVDTDPHPDLSTEVTTASAEGARVGIVMGSDSDWPTMEAAAAALDEFGVPYTAEVVSAHRMPEDMVEWGRTAADRGLDVIIAGAGGAAHLPGMLASLTPLPVIGVPVPLKHLDGMDSLLSIVQMPSGVPVATVSVGGAHNAGLLAVRMLAAAGDRQKLRAALDEHRAGLRATAQAKGRALAHRVATGDGPRH
jgi:phosphoribosylaminoimidazole carboxylase PurE protein